MESVPSEQRINLAPPVDLQDVAYMMHNVRYGNTRTQIQSNDQWLVLNQADAALISDLMQNLSTNIDSNHIES